MLKQASQIPFCPQFLRGVKTCSDTLSVHERPVSVLRENNLSINDIPL